MGNKVLEMASNMVRRNPKTAYTYPAFHWALSQGHIRSEPTQRYGGITCVTQQGRGHGEATLFSHLIREDGMLEAKEALQRLGSRDVRQGDAVARGLLRRKEQDQVVSPQEDVKHLQSSFNFLLKAFFSYAPPFYIT